MLEFTESTQNAKILALHYAKKIGDDFFILFLNSKVEINSPQDAIVVTTFFWKMIDLSIEDNEDGISVEGIDDLEFWMHKLFNKISGYLEKIGFEEQWDKTTKEIKSN